jgi:hypothetical protein
VSENGVGCEACGSAVTEKTAHRVGVQSGEEEIGQPPQPNLVLIAKSLKQGYSVTNFLLRLCKGTVCINY